MKKLFSVLAAGCLAFHISVFAAEPDAPAITNINLIGTQKVIKFTPFPATKKYEILSTTNLASPFVTNSGSITGFTWTGTSSVPVNFYQLRVTPLTSNELLTANVLNRLAYGPTPDEIERILTGPGAIGPDAYIAEQLAPELISETVSNSHANINIIAAKFAGPTDVIPANTASYATINDFRAWHILRAVGAKRQLLEVLLQFFENHFVTQYEKSVDYFDPFYDGGTNEQRLATQFEYLENDKWRNALLNPNCTFYDLLKISAESPAMIIYLDTVTSKGNGSNIANENYARELLELFTFGVDNGYTQNDILNMSRSWTGWTVEIVHPTNAFNPFALRLTNKLNEASSGVVSNLAGVWAFNFKSASHDTTRVKTLFTNAFVPPRFGPPYTTKFYGTNTVAGRYTFGIPTSRTGTNGIQSGYDIIAYLADMPFTQEYISVKLCQLFVHDNFAHGYDYTTDTSPEAQLVRQCMLAWENGSPKGKIRDILSVIFASDLFRSHGGSLQKVKTPLEYTVSAIRALRFSTNGTFMPGTFTADTDGYNLNAPIIRMGAMNLFDRSDPDGYSEAGPYWINAGSLAERIRFVQVYMMIAGQPSYLAATKNEVGVNTVCFPSVLIQSKLSTTARTNAAAVVDLMLNYIYPGEGLGNLNQYRTAAINFLNNGSADSSPNSFLFGSTSVPFSLAANSNYDVRVRGMIAYLLSLQRFHEQ